MAIDFVTSNPAIQARRLLTEDLRNFQVSSLVLSPTLWAQYANPILLDWRKIKFNQEDLDKVPDDAYGIYTFIVEPGVANHPHCSYLLYLGKAEDQSLRARIRQYFYEINNPKGRGPVQDMIVKWHTHLFVCFACVENTALIDGLENSLLQAFVPPVNQTYKGEFGQAYRAWRQI
ncbi:MAG: hypothetical protein KIT77_10630 [Caldilinea sp.]|nr:hypothetical protein [Caldilinea sp.]